MKLEERKIGEELELEWELECEFSRFGEELECQLGFSCFGKVGEELESKWNSPIFEELLPELLY